ncbi:tRNA adenosine(34) deaminase TadA [Planctobacterium marinum]|uniref:tRNA adenosine(34) deaminase TadA n=1 Tax=Planctobacterium marinum TaxID=1631968 RepID=UPI001E2AE14E|nr:tRNA adenosine(34) deaminase TadA [Planctobacterium marinum]MCC2606299.1 tRNA adenosine(34) deaminase TadA [Planctobacterium marinum]
MLKQIKDDDYYMAQALALTPNAEAAGEIPVAAILVKDGEVIAQGWNQSITLNDPSAHAEMMALRQAGSALNNYRMPGTTLYVTLEPCPMCAGALVHSRIERLVYGASDYKTGACGSIMDLVRNDKLNHQISVTSGVLEAQCSSVISDFFKRRREEKKALKRAAQEADRNA